MSENFYKLKRKSFCIRLIKSIVAGASIGLLTAGILLLLTKTERFILPLPTTVLIALGATLVIGTILFLLLHVSDRKLAKRLDKQFSLQEKVQTMLEYKNEQGAMYDLQREDTDRTLAELIKKGVRFQRLWIYLLLLLLGAAALTGALLYTPEPEPPVIEEEVPFALTELQIVALEQLIQSVQDSEMQSPYREQVVEELTVMLDALKVATTIEERDAATDAAISQIYDITDASSQACELIDALWKYDNESVKTLAKTLNYYDWPKADEWDKFNGTLQDFRNTMVHADSTSESPDESKMTQETALWLMNVGTGIKTSVTASAISAEDALSVVLMRLASAEEENADGTRVYGLAKLSTLCPTAGYASTQRELDATLTALGSEIFRALEQHAANTSTGEAAMTKIADMFDATLPLFKRPNLRETSAENVTPDGEDGENIGGGIGSGAVFGSDDLVLDPYTNTYVQYGTILDQYYNLMFGKLQEGGFTDAEKEALEKYFDILYGKTDENENE